MPLVTKGYEDLIPGLNLPDPGDRHVLAAAIRSRADVIVTIEPQRFFPTLSSTLSESEAQHPDEFILHLFEPLARHRAVGCASE